MRSEKSKKVLQTILPFFLLIELFASSLFAAQRSKEIQWEKLGPEGISILTLKSLDNSNILYAIVDAHGIYESSNQGKSWYPINEGIKNPVNQETEIPKVLCLGISPQTEKTMYVGTRDAGIFKSTDAGGRWQSCSTNIKDRFNESKLASVHTLAVVNDSLVYAGVSDQGIYKSENGGATWFSLNTGLRLSLEVLAILPHPQDDKTLYIGTSRGIFKSENGGEKWCQKSNLQANVLTFANDYNTIYAGGEEGLYVSRDAGEKWNIRIRANSNIFSEAKTLLFYENSLLIGSRGAIYEFSDNKFLKYLGNIRRLEDSPIVTGIVKTGERVYIGTGRGIYWRSNEKEWEPLREGLPENGLIVKAITFGEEQSNILYIATWGGGVYKADIQKISPPDTNPKWEYYNQELWEPYVTELQTSKDRVYATTQRTIVKTEGRKEPWKAIFTSEHMKSFLQFPSKLSDCRNLAVSNDMLFTTIKIGRIEGEKWKNWNKVIKGESWHCVFPESDDENYDITEILVDPQNPEKIYVTTEEKGTFERKNGRWTLLKDVESIQAIAIGGKNKKNLYACTKERGSSFIKRDLEKGEGEIIVRSSCHTIVTDPMHPGRLYAADDEGVLIIRPDKSFYWLDTLEDIKVKINDIAIDPNNSNIIYAATEGKSVLWADITDLIDPPLLVYLRRLGKIIENLFSSLPNRVYIFVFCVGVISAIAILFKLLIIIKPPKFRKRKLLTKLRKEIIEFLSSLPNIHGKNERQALISSAGLDEELVRQLTFDEPPSVFFPLLIDICVSYGKQRDGRDPLIAILEAAKNTVGQDKKEICADLISRCSAFNGGDDDE